MVLADLRLQRTPLASRPSLLSRKRSGGLKEIE
jgi:hypothetical protein